MLLASAGWAQPGKTGVLTEVIDQPDAQHTKEALSNLLERYPPALKRTLALDPSLLSNQPYLATYPALVSFLGTHPEVARNPSFYLGEAGPYNAERATGALRVWEEMLSDVSVFAGFALAIGLVIWLIRTLIDYRRWNRLTKVQTDVHTKLLDRFTANEDLLAYIHSPAGSKFLESSPIALDAGPRSVAAPLGRILWTIQGGVVLLAAGIGLEVVSKQVSEDAAQPLHALGVLGIALGVGFVISAVVSFMISRKLGLIEPSNAPGTQG
jgi:hypothetical protein